jgi:hypothetical protein
MAESRRPRGPRGLIKELRRLHRSPVLTCAQLLHALTRMVFQQGCFGHLRRRLRGFALRRPQQAAEKDWFAIMVAAGAFSGVIRWKWDIVPVVLCAGLAGLVFKMLLLPLGH